jgi:hypothetical protein
MPASQKRTADHQQTNKPPLVFCSLLIVIIAVTSLYFLHQHPLFAILPLLLTILSILLTSLHFDNILLSPGLLFLISFLMYFLNILCHPWLVVLQNKGGGLNIASSTASLTACTITSNTATPVSAALPEASLDMAHQQLAS